MHVRADGVRLDCTQSLSFLLVIERLERERCTTVRDETGERGRRPRPFSARLCLTLAPVSRLLRTRKERDCVHSSVRPVQVLWQRLTMLHAELLPQLLSPSLLRNLLTITTRPSKPFSVHMQTAFTDGKSREVGNYKWVCRYSYLLFHSHLSDQFQISPAASPEILHFTQYEAFGFSYLGHGWEMMMILPTLTTSFIHFFSKCWENILFELGSERVRGRPHRWVLASFRFHITYQFRRG